MFCGVEVGWGVLGGGGELGCFGVFLKGWRWVKGFWGVEVGWDVLEGGNELGCIWGVGGGLGCF